ncbi:3-phosphoshikimate 1-carboxyvinyltransferase [Dankookia rubra]|uniref:3-phosphoshikimate 1-carboxyvinyltransferase n=1 Tax=Dankookia rubra TaxID=1442381 RepID=A0A4R5QCF1_9PROT|nr:3-phosphoshikimate 1-carboxyvinyltransferase [Dankookia rubra]TDH60784.1 3-phosphoshikimate 1-carboxyvinyltransferase [Dankookia rubra]
MAHPDAPHPLRAAAPSRGLAGRHTVPGDKSISHRALMFGALAVGTTEISGLLEGEDVLRTAAAMRALGAEVEQTGPGAWRVAGRGVGGLVEPSDVLDMGNSGTAARLLCGLLAGHPIFAVMTGDASLRKRPMRRVTEPLSATGASFWTREGGRLPLAVRGAAEALPLDYTLPVASAQVKSACLLAGLCARGTTRIIEPERTRDHTENMLRHFGATVRVEDLAPGRLVELEGQPELVAAPILVPGDPSSAAFLLVAALLVPRSRVTVENVGLNPLRTGLFTTLREMGARLTVENARVAGGEPVGDVTAEYGPLRAVEVPPGRAPSMIDEYPVLAVAAAAAEGETRMRGLSELRVKESDRLAATAALLAANGISARIEGDDLLVQGRSGAVPGGGLVATHMDHRLAMSALVMGLVARAPVAVDDAAFIETSFPGFAALVNLAAGGPVIGPA